MGNVVATYPNNLHCLGLYNNWHGHWYTNQKVKCMFPEKGRRIGYAVTLVFSLPDPNKTPFSYIDLIETLDQYKNQLL